MNIYLPINMVRDKNITDYEFVTYAAIQSVATNQFFDSYFISTDIVGHLLYGTLKITEQKRKSINTAINGLIEKNLIEVEEHGSCHSFVIKRIELNLQEIPFVIVDSEELATIMRTNIIKLQMRLFRFFAYLLTTFAWKLTITVDDENCKAGIGNRAIKNIAKNCNTSENTIISNFKILEELQLIYVYRGKYYNLSPDEGVGRPINVYGRYKNKKFIISYGEYQDEKMDKKIYNHIHKGDNARSLYQKFYWLKKGKQYSEEEIQLIYDHIKDHNEKYEEWYKNSKEEKYVAKIEDMSVFDKYDFLFR